MATKVTKGPLVLVKLGEGQYVKMYEADAKAAGVPYEVKGKPAAGNKMVTATANKGAAEEEVETPDDLTAIEGVGLATARALEGMGITTFQQLYAAEDLGSLSTMAQKSIATWRESYKPEA